MTKLIIDPVNKITDYRRTIRELQIFLIFSIIVAGKRADVRAALLTRMLAHRPPKEKPLDYLRRLGPKRRDQWLRKHNCGPYKQNNDAIEDVLAANLDLKRCTIHDLVQIRGIKYKTAHFFLLHSREGYDGIVLDTHVLAYLRDNGIEAPLTTPQSAKKYDELEQEVRKLFKRDYPKMTLAEADFALWKKYSGHTNDA